MTAYEIYEMLINYKVPAEHAQILVAVAKSESGLRAAAAGDGGNSIGIFQIHMPSHPDKLEKLTRSKDRGTWIRWLENPANNTIAASMVYHSQGLGAWTEYKNGNYKRYLNIINDSSAGATYQGGSNSKSGGRISLVSADGGGSSGGGGSSRAYGDGTYEKTMDTLVERQSESTAKDLALLAPQVPAEGGKFPSTGNVNAIKTSDRYISEFARVAINYDLNVAGLNGANVPEVIKNRARNLGKVITAAEKEIGYKYPRSNINKIYTR